MQLAIIYLYNLTFYLVMLTNVTITLIDNVARNGPV